MKDRKILSHNDLISEVTKQLASRFHPVPAAIKKRIEALIEASFIIRVLGIPLKYLLLQKEYLERGDDKKSYKYLVRCFT